MQGRSELTQTEIFNSVHLAAKNQDHPAIHAIIDGGFSIDVKDENGLLTPAGLLAAQNDRKGVDFLLRYQADINEVAKGAAYGDNKIYVRELQEAHPCELSSVFGPATFIGFIFNTVGPGSTSPLTEDKYTPFRKNLSVHGHIFAGAWLAGRFNDESSLLNELALIPYDQVRFLIVNVLIAAQRSNLNIIEPRVSTLGLSDLDLTAMTEKKFALKPLRTTASHWAKRINEFIKDYDLNPQQALVCLHVENLTWFREAYQLVKEERLNYTTFILIGATLSGLSYSNAESLHQKISPPHIAQSHSINSEATSSYWNTLKSFASTLPQEIDKAWVSTGYRLLGNRFNLFSTNKMANNENENRQPLDTPAPFQP